MNMNFYQGPIADAAREYLNGGGSDRPGLAKKHAATLYGEDAVKIDDFVAKVFQFSLDTGHALKEADRRKD
jgi:hypothetical protein